MFSPVSLVLCLGSSWAAALTIDGGLVNGGCSDDACQVSFTGLFGALTDPGAETSTSTTKAVDFLSVVSATASITSVELPYGMSIATAVGYSPSSTPTRNSRSNFGLLYPETSIVKATVWSTSTFTHTAYQPSEASIYTSRVSEATDGTAPTVTATEACTRLNITTIPAGPVISYGSYFGSVGTFANTTTSDGNASTTYWFNAASTGFITPNRTLALQPPLYTSSARRAFGSDHWCCMALILVGIMSQVG